MSQDVPIPCPNSPRELGKPFKLLRIVVGTLGHVPDEGWCHSLPSKDNAPSIIRIMNNSRNGHLTGLVIDAYLSRKIQKFGVAGRANAVLPLSALASINSGRGDWL